MNFIGLNLTVTVISVEYSKPTLILRYYFSGLARIY
jgi:hypothetical protein